MKLLIENKKKWKVKFYTIEQLSNLNTKRLLYFYKKERKRYYNFVSGRYCDCCGERYSEIYPDDKYYKEMDVVGTQWEKYLKQIKELLNKREHVSQ